MLSLIRCKQILEENEYHLQDEEIIQLRDFLTRLAIVQLNNKEKDKEYEQSNTVLPCE